MAKNKIPTNPNKLNKEQEQLYRAQLIDDIQKTGKLLNQKLRRANTLPKQPKSQKAIKNYNSKVAKQKKYASALKLNNLLLNGSVGSVVDKKGNVKSVVDNEGKIKYGKSLLNEMTNEQLEDFKRELTAINENKYLKNKTAYEKNRLVYEYGTTGTKNMEAFLSEQLGNEFNKLPFEERQKLIEQALINQLQAEEDGNYTEGSTNESAKVGEVWESYISNNPQRQREIMEQGANPIISKFRNTRR